MFLALPTNNHPTLALLNLAMPACLWYVGHLFSVGKATTRDAVLEVCGALQDVLTDTVLHVHESHMLVAGFHALGFPCVRALDGTHIMVTCLPHGNHPHYNHRQFLSMVLQGFLNHGGMFTHVSTGWAGSAYDVHVF